MRQYAMDTKTVSEAVSGGGLLVVAEWEAKEGQADRVAEILRHFCPKRKANPAQSCS